MFDDYEFAVCLTHDVDRTREGIQGLYYGLRDRDPDRLRGFLSRENDYWQFEHIMRLESSLGVRSAFYFLVERDLFADFPVRSWLSPTNWVRYRGRYDVRAPDVASVVRRLDEGGWEVGLHGSYGSFDDVDRLRYEKSVVESVVGHEIRGGRQHYLNLCRPDTWEHYAALGLQYDTTLGYSDRVGFDHGYGLVEPFDGFVVFPLTIMDIALPTVSTTPQRAWRECERLLEEAAENDAVLSVDWHQRSFSERAFPHFAATYRRLIERAQEMGAWVGPPGDLYDELRTRPALFDRLTTRENGAPPVSSGQTDPRNRSQ